MLELKILIKSMMRQLLLEIELNVVWFVKLTDQQQLTKKYFLMHSFYFCGIIVLYSFSQTFCSKQ